MINPHNLALDYSCLQMVLLRTKNRSYRYYVLRWLWTSPGTFLQGSLGSSRCDQLALAPPAALESGPKFEGRESRAEMLSPSSEVLTEGLDACRPILWYIECQQTSGNCAALSQSYTNKAAASAIPVQLYSSIALPDYDAVSVQLPLSHN